jgi:hypothetical protein
MASSGLNRWPGLPPGRAPARSARAPPKAGANGRGGYRRGQWDRMPEPLTRTVLGGALGPAGRASRPLNLASQWLVTQHHRSQPAVAARRNRDRARSATCRALSGGPCAPVRSPCRPKPGLATAFKAAGAPSHGVGCCSPLRSAEADAITGQSVAVGHAGRHNYPPRRVGRESVGSASGPASPISTEQGRRVGGLGPGLACESADARSGCPANRSAGRAPGFFWHPPAVPA